MARKKIKGKKRIKTKRRIKKVKLERQIKKYKPKPPVWTDRQKRVYKTLLRDYVEKQNELGFPETEFTASRSQFFKNMRKKLKRGGDLKKQGRIQEGNKLIVEALKETTRRDGIPDFIPPGESPNAGLSLAAA